MTVVSNMEITLRPGVRTEAIDAFLKRQVFEECKAAIPGFLNARLLKSQGAETMILVIVEWQDAQAFHDWAAHPVRAKQEQDLSGFLAAAPHTTLFDQVAYLD